MSKERFQILSQNQKSLCKGIGTVNMVFNSPLVVHVATWSASACQWLSCNPEHLGSEHNFIWTLMIRIQIQIQSLTIMIPILTEVREIGVRLGILLDNVDALGFNTALPPCTTYG
eukprot:Gb_36039 [translate_table: standard]